MNDTSCEIVDEWELSIFIIYCIESWEGEFLHHCLHGEDFHVEHRSAALMRELHETPRRPSLRPSSASFFSFSTSDRFLAAEQIIRFRSFLYHWAEVF